MSRTVTPALQTKTAPNQIAAFKDHIYTMGAAFAGVIFGVLGSMGFVGNYLDSQFAAQNAALDKRMVAAAPASDLSGACYGTSTASTGAADNKVAHADEVGGRGADETAPTPGGGSGGGDSTPPFVHQIINGSISNTGPNSTNTINASNNFNYSETNNNNVTVSNSNHQTSNSGSATSSTNTNGGSAASGASHNQNTTSSSVDIRN